MTSLTITGKHLIGLTEQGEPDPTFQGVDPRTGRPLPGAFAEAGPDDVAAATRLAWRAARELRSWPAERIASLLRAMVAGLETHGEQIVTLADSETGLGRPRLQGELARTLGQFRMFAEIVESGEHLGIIIDHADPDSVPPRPDLRRMLVPIGPVAVFGASNFPLAFSVPGGDTASALAAGCPVVIKAHPSHPATSEATARCLIRAAADEGAPDGTVSLLQGRTHEGGGGLVLDPRVAAVAFTGSRQGGRALMDLAATRDTPIPVHAEMSSLNPVVVTPAAISARAAAIASGFVASLTLGTGQFCTKPGLLLLPEGEAADAMLADIVHQLSAVPPTPLLNRGIHELLSERLGGSTAAVGVTVRLDGRDSERTEGFTCRPTLIEVDVETYLQHAELREEHFGPVSVVVRHRPDQLHDLVASLDGQLTATLQAEAGELDSLRELRDLLSARVGRILWNGFPTGVSVTRSQHHGGPYPATSDPRFTSVGGTAIDRFLRPVVYQDMPDGLLPEAIRSDDPLGLPHTLNGVRRPGSTR
jgi:acyl-CoA reductase-like NAD-dependent aldehyde dehydrogenase